MKRFFEKRFRHTLREREKEGHYALVLLENDLQVCTPSILRGSGLKFVNVSDLAKLRLYCMTGSVSGFGHYIRIGMLSPQTPWALHQDLTS